MWRTPEQDPEGDGATRHPHIAGVRRGQRTQASVTSSLSYVTVQQQRRESDKKPTDSVESFVEKLGKQAKAQQTLEDANKIMVSSMLENLKRYVEEIEQDNWLYEDQSLHLQ